MTILTPSSLSQPAAPNQNLCHVLDRHLKPLCLLPDKEARAQSVLHQEIILLGLAANRLLLRTGTNIDALAQEPLPYTLTPHEAAEMMLNKTLGISCPVRHLADILPCPATFGGIGHIMAAIISPALADALENPHFALFLIDDLKALATRQILGEIPLLLGEIHLFN